MQPFLEKAIELNALIEKQAQFGRRMTQKN